MSRNPNVLRAVTERPWAILEGTLQTIGELVAAHNAGERLSREEIEARISAGPGQGGGYDVAGGVAVIPISGVITPRASLFSDVSGGTSVEGLRNSFRDALAARDVRAILFDVNSPGGAVNLVPELAGDIREARGEKPIVAQANTLMASAAYWLSSQADEVYVTPSGNVGSIGVFGVHTDISDAEAQAGRKTTLISAGKFKTEASPYGPLNPEAREHLQGLVNASYELFVDGVAEARGATAEAVRSGYGQGRVLEPKAALAAGLVDGVQTFEQTARNLMRSTADAPAASASVLNVAGEVAATTWAASSVRLRGTLVDDADAARAAAADVVTRIGALREVREGRLTAAKGKRSQRSPSSSCSSRTRSPQR